MRADTKERGPDDETSMEPISERILQPNAIGYAITRDYTFRVICVKQTHGKRNLNEIFDYMRY